MSATTLQPTNTRDTAGVPPAPPETHQPAVPPEQTELDRVEGDGFSIDDGGDFFAPVSFDLISSLLSEYEAHRHSIAAVAEFVSGRTASSVIHYFLEGNRTEERGRMSLEMSSAQLFDPAGAMGALRAAHWSKALQLTDVLDLMPQKRRDEWHAQIKHPCGSRKDWHTVRNERAQWPERFDDQGEYLDPAEAYAQPPLPDFSEDTVRNTLAGLLAMRAQFLGERVDGIFRGLSGEHVTNAPEAFGKRMIVAHVLTSYDTSNHSQTGMINDLRCVIAKFMGRDEPRFCATDSLLMRSLKGNWGQWVTVDGGALRIRLYKKGTAHLEVHPDMAWRLNQILAHLYPAAIPAEFRQRPKRRARTVELIRRPLPFAVLAVLGDLKPATRKRVPDWPERWDEVRNTVAFYGRDLDKHVAEEVRGVLQALGGTPTENGLWFEFDYYPFEVIREVVVSGCMPDTKAHQFYPTRERLAREVIDLADIGDDDQCCEPSAGTGGLADYMPKDRTTCVEVSSLHCKVLAAKGFNVVCDDFLAWSELSGKAGSFDPLVMNPPFDCGRWRAHVDHAAQLVRQGGRLVAILPSSARGTELPDFNTTWAGPYVNEFPGASVEVVVLVAEKVG